MRSTRTRTLWLPPSARERGELDFWPRCVKCAKAVHQYEIAEEGSHRVEVIARCTHDENPRGPYKKQHYDCLRIEFSGDVPEPDELKKAISALKFFTDEVFN